ncbi:hypothetical protein BJF78_28545 [Pseudonocardia sp. CNS-139]|nr:hypothetical protein BJF78_28545 [Pseudonocardia sp. CNS-139]
MTSPATPRTRRPALLGRAAAVVAVLVPALLASGAEAVAADHVGTSDTTVRFTVPDRVPAGAPIRLSGTGWRAPSGGGSVVAVKLDDGAVATTRDVRHPGTGAVQANRTIYGIAQADATGSWTLEVPFPTAQNSSASWAAGQTHSVRLLTGTLLAGDAIRTETASFTVVAAGGATTTPTAPPTTTVPPRPGRPDDHAPGAPDHRPADHPARHDPAGADGHGDLDRAAAGRRVHGAGRDRRGAATAEVGGALRLTGTLVPSRPGGGSGRRRQDRRVRRRRQDRRRRLQPPPGPGGRRAAAHRDGLVPSRGGGSVVAVKIDDGAYSHLPGQGPNANLTVWQVVQAGADGRIDVTVTLPTATNATPAFGPGAHTLRLLTGSLAPGDTIRTVQTPEFTVTAPAARGPWTPGGRPPSPTPTTPSRTSPTRAAAASASPRPAGSSR